MLIRSRSRLRAASCSGLPARRSRAAGPRSGLQRDGVGTGRHGERRAAADLPLRRRTARRRSQTARLIGDAIVADSWQRGRHGLGGNPRLPAPAPAGRRAPGSRPPPPCGVQHWGVAARAGAARRCSNGRNVEDLQASANRRTPTASTSISAHSSFYHGGQNPARHHGDRLRRRDLNARSSRCTSTARAQPLLAEQGVPFTALLGRVAARLSVTAITFEDPSAMAPARQQALVTAAPDGPGSVSPSGAMRRLRIREGRAGSRSAGARVGATEGHRLGQDQTSAPTPSEGSTSRSTSSDVGELLPLVPVLAPRAALVAAVRAGAM
jgi:hypothetical protein